MSQYKNAIKDAKARLKAGKKIKTNDGYKGVARVDIKSIEELAADREAASKNAAAAEK